MQKIQNNFSGQAVEYPGTAMTNTLKNVPKKLIEIPVAEEMQLGISNGLALNNFTQSVYFHDGIFYY